MAGGLSTKERDRRYGVIRQYMREQGIDCVIAGGTNLFYLTNGLPGETAGLIAREDVPPTVGIYRRHLVDIPPQVVVDAQDWIQDVRRNGENPQTMTARVRELGLEKGVIGTSLPGMEPRYKAELQKELPDATFVDASAVFANARSIKGEEEIALIDKANHIFDAAVIAVQQNVRPGMTGAEAVQEGIKAMWQAGGDLDSTFSFNFGPIAAQSPVLAHYCLDRPIKSGDIGAMTAHSEYHHYAGHSDQVISFGEPSVLHREMFQASLSVREAVLGKVKAGVTQRDLAEVYEQACRETGFRSSPHSQIHPYGIDVPEFPGPAFQVPDPGGNADKANLGRVGNFVLAEGMIYSISPTIIARDTEDLILGGTSLVVTADGFRELGNRKVELLVAAG